MGRPAALALALLLVSGLAACDPASGEGDAEPRPSWVEGDPQRVRGETLFRRRGCLACHKLASGGEGRSTGPDLAGVTARRGPDWFMGMVLNPDSMRAVDPVAQALWVEFQWMMPDLDLTEDQAEAIWSYLRAGDQAGWPDSSPAP